MAFNTALSGLRAAQGDLSITGNNIANASTVGFKESRAEFSDLYAASISGVSSRAIGNGTLLSNVGQQFSQGNISFTDNNLDLAINGNGFFMLEMGGAIQYSRSGILGLDKDGYIVNNQGARLQGFGATTSGQIGGNLVDLQISTENQSPQATSEVDTILNLDSRSSSLNTNGILPIFDATDPTTYTHATSSTIYDSLGNSHVLSQYYVRDDTSSVRMTLSGAATTGNIYVQEPAGTGARIDLSGLGLTGTTASLDADGQIIANYINTNSSLSAYSATYDSRTNELVIAKADGSGFSIGADGAAATLTGGAVAAPTATTTTMSLTLGNSAPSPGDQVTLSSGGVNAVIDLNNVDSDGDGVLDGPLTGAPATDGPALANHINANIAGYTATYTGGQLSITRADAQDFSLAPNSTTAGTLIGSSTTANSAVAAAGLTTVDPNDPANPYYAENRWLLYVQVGGDDVGGTAGSVPPALQQHVVRFNTSGAMSTIDGSATNQITVDNWDPMNGAIGPTGTTTSAFTIDFAGTTQYGSPFAVNGSSQNGYSTGRLVGVDIDDGGTVLARYSNGQSTVLGGVALANFNNPQGLTPIGDNAWTESFDSGSPIIGNPGTSSLGLVQSGALEDSNVDLSDELVNLILAQRNYQANAKTIETADALTQTIINIR